MTAVEYVKLKGLSSLTEASRIGGVPIQTLKDWYANESFRRRFEVLVAGCVAIKEAGK